MLGRAALPLLATATRGRHGGSCPSPYFSKSTWYTTNAGQTRDFNTARTTRLSVRKQDSGVAEVDHDRSVVGRLLPLACVAVTERSGRSL